MMLQGVGEERVVHGHPPAATGNTGSSEGKLQEAHKNATIARAHQCLDHHNRNFPEANWVQNSLNVEC
jgi:hypothetical protein